MEHLDAPVHVHVLGGEVALDRLLEDVLRDTAVPGRRRPVDISQDGAAGELHAAHGLAVDEAVRLHRQLPGAQRALQTPLPEQLHRAHAHTAGLRVTRPLGKPVDHDELNPETLQEHSGTQADRTRTDYEDSGTGRQHRLTSPSRWHLGACRGTWARSSHIG